ncbi:SPOR domain-containing protein, partial [Cribrihabitans sp. XS_ASV171]
MRREEVEEETAVEAQAAALDSGEIQESSLEPVAGAAAAIDAAEPTTPAPVAAAPAAKPAPKPKASSLDKPYIQIGIFSVEANAERTAGQMRSAGMVPTVREETINGKAFWRVVVGPAQSTSERSALLRKVQGIG